MAKASMHGSSEKEGKAWGKGQNANMPKEVKMDSYPRSNQFGPSNLDDTMKEIDRVNGVAHKRARSRMSNQH